MKKSQALAALLIGLLCGGFAPCAAGPIGRGRGRPVAGGGRRARSALVQASAAGGAAVAEDSDPKKYPVSKVVSLLRDMQAQLSKEADEDQEVYDKMMCWCQTNDREKTLALQDAQARIAELTTLIETTAAQSASLGQEIVNHEQELAKSQESLDTATALREKQAAEFHGEEKDMIQSIKALEAAIVVLSKHHQGTAFLDQGLLAGTVESVRYQLERHHNLLLGSITPRQRRLVLALGQQPTFRQSYAPQSGEIFGILKQMKDTFQSNLDESQKEEVSNKKAYEEIKAAKEEEIRATQAAVNQKRTRLAETDEKNAEAKQEIEDLQNSLTVDDKFLLDLKERCAATQQEYDSRVRMRQQELTAVAEAIKILSDDQARDTFSKVLNPASLLQRDSRRSRRGAGRDRAAALLSVAGSEAGNPKLVALAVAARLDPLTRVKAAIDDLVAELLEEKRQEIAKRDDCIARSNENERLTETYQRDQSDLQTKIDGYKTAISEATNHLKTLNAEIADLQLQIKRKGEDRELENKDFQTTVADQREMQTLLAKALQVLKSVYATQDVVAEPPGGGASLAQVRQPEAPPPGFSTYGRGRASGGVIGLLEQIIQNTAALEKEAMRDEQAAQEEYERFVKDTNASIQAKQQQIVNQNSAKSDAEQELISTEEDLRTKTSELETLSNTASAIKMDCDFLVRNFDVRQEARDQEVDALREAKAVLSGMRLE